MCLYQVIRALFLQLCDARLRLVFYLIQKAKQIAAVYSGNTRSSIKNRRLLLHFLLKC